MRIKNLKDLFSKNLMMIFQQDNSMIQDISVKKLKTISLKFVIK